MRSEVAAVSNSGYILGLIEQLARALGTLMLRRKAGDSSAAQREIDQAARELLGLSGEDLGRLTLGEWHVLLQPFGRLDLDRCVVAAHLLEHHSELSQDPAAKERSERLFELAWHQAEPARRREIEARLRGCVDGAPPTAG